MHGAPQPRSQPALQAKECSQIGRLLKMDGEIDSVRGDARHVKRSHTIFAGQFGGQRRQFGGQRHLTRRGAGRRRVAGGAPLAVRSQQTRRPSARAAAASPWVC
jgi:hypothetical protein